jgi:hypothetical protein
MTNPVILKNLDQSLVRRLQVKAERRQSDVPTMIEEFLKRSFPEPVRSDKHGPIYRDLSRFSGTWSESEYQDFRRNTECLEQIDEDLWK